MSWTKKNVHPGKIVSTSQEVEVMVLEVDPDKRRISLGLKQCMDNPWDSFKDKFPTGTEVEGEIKNITEFGLFIGLDQDIDGMVHLSDLDWEKSGEEAVADYNRGDVVKAVVLDIDIDKERISLGIKQLTDDPFKGATSGVKKGDRVTCTVTEVTTGGLEVATSDGAPGFIRKAELARDRGEQRPDRFAVGEKLDARITNIDSNNRKSHALGQSARNRRREAGDGRIRLLRQWRQPWRYSRPGDQEEPDPGRRREATTRKARARSFFQPGTRPNLTRSQRFGTFNRRSLSAYVPRLAFRALCMTKSDLIKRLAEANPHLTQRDIEKIVSTVFDEVTEALARRDRVELRGFGAFSVREREARVGRNPRTGAEVSVP